MLMRDVYLLGKIEVKIIEEHIYPEDEATCSVMCFKMVDGIK
jgi:hypothetical protein